MSKFVMSVVPDSHGYAFFRAINKRRNAIAAGEPSILWKV